jgi:hypothetical protein
MFLGSTRNQAYRLPMTSLLPFHRGTLARATRTAHVADVKEVRLIDDDEDMLAVHHVPITVLPIPIAVLMAVPINMIPVVIRVNGCAFSGVHRGPFTGANHRGGVRILC